MDFLQILFLSLVQGFTEFLPISSSAHLILVPKFLSWKDQGLAFDVALHVGTLLAVLAYFKTEVLTLLRDFFLSVKSRKSIGESTLAYGIVVATIPVGLAGLLFNDFISEHLRSPFVIAMSTVLFAFALWYADTKAGQKNEGNITLFIALLIGLAQAIALIPGTSRSGITITAALLLGFSRVAAARFSFLLSIPVIVLAGGLKVIELIQSDTQVIWSDLFLAVLFSSLSAYLCIHWFLKIIQSLSMLPFVLYRLFLGVVLLLVF